MIDDLKTLDSELYKNLMFLQSYDGDVNDLSLTFSVTESEFGKTNEINLIPNGSNISVTNNNKYQYVQLIAKYYLHDRIFEQTGSFFQYLYYFNFFKFFKFL